MVPRCKHCGQYFTDQWSPSIDGEATKEVRDWFAKEMPEEWEEYLKHTDHTTAYGFKGGIIRFTTSLNAQLSITNLAQFIVENYKEMQLNAEAVKVIEQKEGKE